MPRGGRGGRGRRQPISKRQFRDAIRTINALSSRTRQQQASRRRQRAIPAAPRFYQISTRSRREVSSPEVREAQHEIDLRSKRPRLIQQDSGSVGYQDSASDGGYQDDGAASFMINAYLNEGGKRTLFEGTPNDRVNAEEATRQASIEGVAIPPNFFILPSEILRCIEVLPDENENGVPKIRRGVNGGIELNVNVIWPEMRALMEDNRALRNAFIIEDEKWPDLSRRQGRNFDLGLYLSRLGESIARERTTDGTPFIITGRRQGSRLGITLHSMSRIYDFPNILAFFLLERLFELAQANSGRSVTVGFSMQIENADAPDDRGIQAPIILPQTRSNGFPITMTEGRISLRGFSHLYMHIMSTLLNDIATTEFDSLKSWNGSEDSGTSINIRLARASQADLIISLTALRNVASSQSHRWTQEVEDLIMKTVKDSVHSVRNKDDNMCTLYCILMGLMIKFHPNGIRHFGKSLPTMIEPEYIISKAIVLGEIERENPLSQLIRRLALLVWPPTYSSGVIQRDDPLVPFLEHMDENVGKLISFADFKEEFSLMESAIFPDKNYGVDVYGIDFSVNNHIYPMYISSNRKNVINLLTLTPKDLTSTHCALIMNMRTLFKGSDGKTFYSCSDCKQCFYHKRLLREHKEKCPKSGINRYVVPDDENGFHYSKVGVCPEISVISGVCQKCKLCFTDDFFFEYHEKHCMMKGKVGTRHVQLKSYDPNEKLELTGEEIDLSREVDDMQNRRIIYADFECMIEKETGNHKFMSYGVYDWFSGKYQCGYDLGEFIRFIADTAFTNREQHVHVYFHNAMGYDANFILRYILATPEYENWGISVIMKSSNKLQKLVFYAKRMMAGKKVKRTIHIGDTFLFLTLSLEKIVDSIRKDDVVVNEMNFERFFEIMRQRYPFIEDDEEIDHILRKNIFPYKFFDEPSKLDVEIEDFLKIFEAKEENLQFFSERVTVADLQNGYSDTKHVIETFRCKNARDYHDLYLCCDVMQLADVFNRSTHILWESHRIFLPKYLGMPSASWAAFLRHNPAMSIPLYSNTFFAEFFKEMTRGGITSAVMRHAQADDKHSIIYLDVNGLYPFVMQKYDYPCGSFRFIPLGWENEMCSIKLQEYFERCEHEHKGYCFCVDLHFPREVKNKTDMYPFAPEHRKIVKEYYEDADKTTLTPFLKQWSEANEGSKMPEFTGLVCTLYDREKYNVHWKLLRFYMQHGVVVRKVYFGVSFDEGDYLAGYIRKNIEIRNTRKDELGKVLYKLLGNSIYGKTYESPFKRNTYEIIRDLTKLDGLIRENRVSCIYPIEDLGWITKFDGDDIVLDKPTYIGACVCEFSKLHMYQLLYDEIMPLFPDVEGDSEAGCQLVYTDTDSFILRVRHPDGVGKTPKELFAYIASKNPGLIGNIGGQVKSETGEDQTIEEIYALRSKVYCYRQTDGHIGKRAKGTTYDAQEMQLNWESYEQAFRTLTAVNTRNTQFVRRTFSISTQEMSRQSLSVNDGKREICADGIHTHAFGFHI